MRKENGRMDIATRTSYPKQRLFRFIVKDGYLLLDRSCKGRGYYLLKEESSILLAKKRHLLSRLGKIEDEDAFFANLLTLLEKEKHNG